MYFKKLFCVLFLGSLGLFDAVFSQCPLINLSHGKIRYSNRGRRVRFTCFKPYTLIGNTRLDCEDGEWNGFPPVCASKNCDVLPKLYHGKITYYNDRAVAKIQCDPDFTLIGSSDMHCMLQGWNDTSTPECLANSIRQFGSCHFEPNMQRCKWISKSGLFNWTILSTDPKDNIHMPADSFPTSDHTSLSNSSGHILYLETLFAPTKAWLQIMNTKNAPARYISPLFPPIEDGKSYCLIFYLFANGAHTGIITVFANEESIWKSNGSLGTEWNKITIPLHNRSTQFRITIEGKGELGYYTKTAIDDLKIVDGEECEEVNQTEESTDYTTQRSTTKTSNQVFTAIIENNLETERSNELQNHQFSFTTSPPHESSKLITVTTLSNHIETNNRTISNNDIQVSEELNALSSKAEEIQMTTSSDEIIITENNIIYHYFNAKMSKNNNNIIVEEVDKNSTSDQKNDDKLHTSITTTLSPSMERKFLSERKVFYSDLAALKHHLPIEKHETTELSFTKTTHLTSVSKDVIVEPNDAKYQYNHENANSPDRIEQKGNDTWHDENIGNVLLKSDNQNNEIKNMNKSNNYLISNKILCMVLLAVAGIMLLAVILSYKRYREWNRRKDDSFIRFMEKDDGKTGSSRKKNNVLMLKMNRIPQK